MTVARVTGVFWEAPLDGGPLNGIAKIELRIARDKKDEPRMAEVSATNSGGDRLVIFRVPIDPTSTIDLSQSAPGGVSATWDEGSEEEPATYRAETDASQFRN